ncbi:unnamed protein product [Urochloa humidicola]
MAALVPIKPLNGHGSYLRWKESMLLRVHALDVAGALSEPRPAAAGDAAAAKWARDDAVCRGHILAALSDRLLPDYARFATAAELWRALARTYDVEARLRARMDEFHAFTFDEGAGGEVLLEQIAHSEALGAAAGLPGDYVAHELCGKLPELVGAAVIVRSGGSGNDEMGMGLVWDVARRVVGIPPEHLWKTAAAMYDD